MLEKLKGINNPRVTVIQNDGIEFLKSTNEKFDVIFFGWALSYFDHDELLKLFKVALTEQKSTQIPGTIRVDGEQIYVVAGDQIELEVLELQAAGKRRMESALFVKGNEINQKVCQ